MSPFSEKATDPHGKRVVDMMTIDNLPNELPRDASEAFGQQFIEHIMGELLKKDQSEMLRRATIAVAGQLGRDFQYLKDYVEVEEPVD